MRKLGQKGRYTLLITKQNRRKAAAAAQFDRVTPGKGYLNDFLEAKFYRRAIIVFYLDDELYRKYDGADELYDLYEERIKLRGKFIRLLRLNFLTTSELFEIRISLLISFEGKAIKEISVQNFPSVIVLSKSDSKIRRSVYLIISDLISIKAITIFSDGLISILSDISDYTLAELIEIVSISYKKLLLRSNNLRLPKYLVILLGLSVNKRLLEIFT